jgi:hypothetical protein
MAVVPNNNLPPESQPWARDRDAAIAQLQYDAVKASQDMTNAFLGVNNALESIGKQVEQIAQATAAATAAANAAAAAAAAANGAVADLAARVTVSSTAPPFNTGVIPTGGAITWYTANQAALSVNVPTGKMLVTVSCGEVSLSGGGGMGGVLSYAVPSAGIAVGGPEGRLYTSNAALGASIALSRVVNVTPGVHTIQGVPGAYSFVGGSSANLLTIVLTVQVIV